MSESYYTGVGSREIPSHMEFFMVALGKYLALKGWVLRSGGADGSDAAFEKGCNLGSGKKQIFLPWKGFNGNDSTLSLELLENKGYAKDLVCEQVENFLDRPKAHRQLFARNVYQVLGPNLMEPSKFLVCYTKGGGRVGGTRIALGIAAKFDVECFNLYNVDVCLPFMRKMGISNLVYDGLISEMPANGVFVFGSNPDGIHGAGAAKFAAENFCAVVGEGEGFTGRCYALPTKNIHKGERSISPLDIQNNISKLYAAAIEHSARWFFIAYTGDGTNLNGYSNEEMASFFAATSIPPNIVFERKFYRLVKKHHKTLI